MTKPISFHDLTQTKEIPAALLKRTEADLSFFMEKVDPIIAAVKEEGDAALIRFAKAFDGVQVETFFFNSEPEEFAASF